MREKEMNMTKLNDLLYPKVSVIIATYRRMGSFAKALISVCKQSYTNIEIVIVDDNANEDWNLKVMKIIEMVIPESPFRIIYHKNATNNGSAKTRNKGIDLSTGSYITFLDDDDIYLSEKVSSQVNNMMENDSAFSITDIWLFDEREILIEKRIRHYLLDCNGENLLKFHMLYHITGTDVMMFKKEYLDSIGGFPPIDIGDEFYLMQKAIEGKGKFSYLPRCDVKAYVHKETDGLSSGNTKVLGENQLYQYKKNYFYLLSKAEKRYVKMRHFAVLAYAEMRRKKFILFLKYSLFSFCSSPIGCLRLYISLA